MFLAFNKLLHFIYLSVKLNDILGATDSLGSDLVACSHVVYDARPMWDEDYEWYHS